MVNPDACITCVPPEICQKICDYIVNDTGDQTMKVTLNQNEKPHFENGKTILNLACTVKSLNDKVLSYLFENITFVLTDSQRTCRPIVSGFFRALSPHNRARVHKIAIPVFTVRGLFDPVYLTNPLFLEPHLRDSPGIIDHAQLHPYVLERLDQRDNPGLRHTEDTLRWEIVYALTLLNQMRGLKCLKLGVDVIEFLACSVIRETQSAAQTPNLAATLDQVRQGRVNSEHALLYALSTVRGIVRSRLVQLELNWKDFVSNTYTRAGVVFGPLWTIAVKEEMEARFKKIVAAYITGEYGYNDSVWTFD